MAKRLGAELRKFAKEAVVDGERVRGSGKLTG